MSRLPSLRGLQAFEAVARIGNLAAAAERLHITPSAVSHRIRGLESELGVQLLQRTSAGLRLTEAGRRYRHGVEEAFALLAEATSGLIGPDLARPLTISLTSEFGMRWLMPRFHRFRESYPDVETAILSTYRLTDLSAGEADLALRYGEGVWPGLESDLILRFSVTPLCTPELARRLHGLSPAEAIERSTLIRSVEESHEDWDAWLQAAGASGVRPSSQLRFADYSMSTKAALSGQGLLLGYLGYVDQELSEGMLVRPFDLIIPLTKGYHLVYVKERLNDPRVSAFRDWVISESDEADIRRASETPTLAAARSEE